MNGKIAVLHAVEESWTLIPNQVLNPSSRCFFPFPWTVTFFFCHNRSCIYSILSFHHNALAYWVLQLEWERSCILDYTGTNTNCFEKNKNKNAITNGNKARSKGNQNDHTFFTKRKVQI